MSNASDSTTLTLRLDRDLVAAAERYADQHGVSVTGLVTRYFEALTAATEEEVPEDWHADLSPWARSLAQRRPAIELTEDMCYQHLENKHR